MDSKFENEFGQEEERVRGRSRRRGAVAASAASIGAEIGSGAGSAGQESRRQRSAAVRAAGYGSAAHRTAAVQETAAGGDGAIKPSSSSKVCASLILPRSFDEFGYPEVYQATCLRISRTPVYSPLYSVSSLP